MRVTIKIFQSYIERVTDKALIYFFVFVSLFTRVKIFMYIFIVTMYNLTST